MERKQNFNGKLYFQDSFFRFLTLDIDQSHQECYNKVKHLLTEKILHNTQDTLVGIIETIRIIKSQNREDFLQSFIRPGPDTLISKDVMTNYNNLKSMLIGLLFCQSITNITELKSFKEQWRKYADTQGEPYLLLGDHQLLYEKFSSVGSLDELNDFLVYFRNFIAVRMIEFATDTETLIGQTLIKLETVNGVQAFRNDLDKRYKDFAKNLSKLKDKAVVPIDS